MRKTYVLVLLSICLFSCQEKKMDRFEREAREFTAKNCPISLDSMTTQDSLVFVKEGKGNLILYYGIALGDDHKGIFEKVKQDLIDENLQMVRNSVALMDYKNADVTFTYVYIDKKTGKEMLRVDFPIDKYK